MMVLPKILPRPKPRPDQLQTKTLSLTLILAGLGFRAYYICKTETCSDQTLRTGFGTAYCMKQTW